MPHRPITTLTIFGTRPEAIKLAPVIRQLHSDPDNFRCVVAVTAQHRADVDSVNEAVRIDIVAERGGCDRHPVASILADRRSCSYDRG